MDCPRPLAHMAVAVLEADSPLAGVLASLTGGRPALGAEVVATLEALAALEDQTEEEILPWRRGPTTSSSTVTSA